MYRLELLPVAGLILLPVGGGLRSWQPLFQPRNHCCMIGGNFRQHAKSRSRDGVQSDSFRRSETLEELKNLSSRIGKIAPRNMALVNEQYSSVGRCGGCDGRGCGADRCACLTACRLVGVGANLRVRSSIMDNRS